VVGGLLAAPLTYTLRASQLPGTDYLVLAGFALLWTVFCSSLAVGVSALFSTGRRAIAGTLGTYIAFLFLWDWLPNQIVRRVYPSDQQYPPPEWVQVWNKLDPISGYTDATSLLLYRPDEALAVYETMPFLAAVVAAWAVLPMGVALWRFPNVDL
jgi:ABC-type transport system involved in multi-copper enzyme maturation permease subunit